MSKLKALVKPTMVIHLGDEVDNHAASFHASDPDLKSAGEELDLSIKYIAELGELFPNLKLMESNHGSLYYRKALTVSIPRRALRTYKEVLEAPTPWEWHKELTVVLPNGQKCLFTHQLGPSTYRNTILKGTNIVQGHYHSQLEAYIHHDNGGTKRFGITGGCLIDNKSLAFAYNKTNPKEPKLGAVVIVGGNPMLVTMSLNSEGRWEGFRGL